MRIITGILGGRQFASPRGNRTHPMSDKMRGALFNMLGDVSGLQVLDAFAGSGALGFEAMSRGAASVLMIEKDRSAQQAIIENIANLQLGNAIRLVSASAGGWLNTQTKPTVYDLILLDPPYDALQMELLGKLANLLSHRGILALSWPGNVTPPEFNGLKRLKNKQYGDASLHIYGSV